MTARRISTPLTTMTTFEKLTAEIEQAHWNHTDCSLSAIPGKIWIHDNSDHERNVSITANIGAADYSAESCDAWATILEKLAKNFRAKAERHRRDDAS